MLSGSNPLKISLFFGNVKNNLCNSFQNKTQPAIYISGNQMQFTLKKKHMRFIDRDDRWMNSIQLKKQKQQVKWNNNE